MHVFVLRLSTTHNGYKTSKICLKLQIPYYHPLNLWLLGATNGNHGQTVMQPLRATAARATLAHNPCAQPLRATPARNPCVQPLRATLARNPCARNPCARNPCATLCYTDWLSVPTTPARTTLIGSSDWLGVPTTPARTTLRATPARATLATPAQPLQPLRATLARATPACATLARNPLLH